MTFSATRVSFDSDFMFVDLDDGRRLGIPLYWYPRLYDATHDQRCKVRIFGRGTGLTWEELDEDISIEGLLAGKMDNTVKGRARRAEIEAAMHAAE